ncbi:helix-hairpin-helix domain-containing protein [Lentibacillus amyloliquefaciens]|uniref:Competence protein ComEA n=1 Tax=Lentibacillus amyloliquefaciens TaxID=1472767 RepID=A0A0U4FCC6_9BACI|nr:helix-hairpin-helix domain-containing protein [Lentibacillus amyloliquefaciens]ALX48141.1 competence protein ComEA [Lentibacillus amyloliquefaciens]
MLEPLKKYLFPVIIAVLVAAFLFFNPDDKENVVSKSQDITEEQQENEEQVAPEMVMVDVKGEVEAPGVYEIETGSRVNDVIQMAGGFTKGADQTMVNLAQRVQDEMIIMIPETGSQASGSVIEKSGQDKVRINHAEQSEIEQLNGIGPSKAAAIIQYRDENGPFKAEEDLLDVSGIGEKTLESLKDDIQIP